MGGYAVEAVEKTSVLNLLLNVEIEEYPIYGTADCAAAIALYVGMATSWD